MADDDVQRPTSDELAQVRTDMAGQRTRWAADRTLWAADRTFIAWLRTAISMIGFGFALGKTGDALDDSGVYSDQFMSLQIVGFALIALAVLGLSGALIQSIRIAKRLTDAGYPRMEPTPLGTVMGVLVLAVGVVGAVFVFV